MEREVPIVDLEDFALELARTAGGIAMAHFRKPVSVHNKGRGVFDPVTTADRAIERVLCAQIAERYPDHGIVAEEEGSRAGNAPYTWFIDPIDGTRSFMIGSPLWGTLIGVTHYEMPLFGLLCQPVLEEIFFGAPSGGWLVKPDRRERLKARDCRRLADAALATTDPALFTASEARAFDALAKRCLFRRFSGDCYNYAMLAAGFVDLVVESGLKAYDIVPIIPILEGAGAVVTDWHGRAPLSGGSVVAAATATLHAEALAILQAEAPA
ncbi:MAG TPA: inositol monophosphatase family protein [Gammaproteobacteria bacterium]